MHTQRQYRAPCDTVVSRVTLLVVVATATFVPGWPVQGQTASDPSSGVQQSNAPDSHMSEALRSALHKVVVLPGASPADEEISGTYNEETPGLLGGMAAGSRIGTVRTEVGGVNVNFPIPILTIPGAIIGGLSGAAKRNVQDFRDALTKDLAKASNEPLTNDGLALDVYRGLKRIPGLESKLFALTTPIPDDTDAVLYVGFNELTIDAEGDEAILTTSAKVTVRRRSDGTDLYESKIQYQDRDTLENWTENENALWHDYANFARHYLGREISAEVFDRIELRHELRPKKSGTVNLVKKNEWQNVSRSTTPTLAWELTLPGGDSNGSWAEAIAEPDIYYDVEIYDTHRLVYAEDQVHGSQHTLAYEIEPCKTYRWSVRPSYHIGDTIKYGEWMRSDSDKEITIGFDKGIVGRNASAAPAYIQDFASLKIECGRR